MLGKLIKESMKVESNPHLLALIKDREPIPAAIDLLDAAIAALMEELNPLKRKEGLYFDRLMTVFHLIDDAIFELEKGRG